MIRQAHTYLVGAMSGATLIAIAIAAFVVLVSAQVFRDWPIAALGDGGGDTAALSTAHPAAGAPGGSAAAPNAAAGSAGRRGAGGVAGVKAGGGSSPKQDAVAPNGGGPVPGSEATSPVAQGGSPSGGETGSGGDSGGSQPNAATQSPGSASAGGGSGSAGGGSGGKGTTSGGGGGSTASAPSGQVTETVNNTVTKVDETALGGALGNSGVTEATEGVVEKVVGPESTVGHVVDETVGAVGGLLHPNR